MIDTGDTTTDRHEEALDWLIGRFARNERLSTHANVAHLISLAH